MRTKQEIFNKVVKHLINQKGASMGLDDSGEPECMYFGDKSKTCAVGCLIPEKFKSQIIREGNNYSIVSHLMESMPEVVPYLYDESSMSESDAYILLSQLQHIHDDTSNWNDNNFVGHEAFAQVALTFKLDTPPSLKQLV